MRVSIAMMTKPKLQNKVKLSSIAPHSAVFNFINKMNEMFEHIIRKNKNIAFPLILEINAAHS